MKRQILLLLLVLMHMFLVINSLYADGISALGIYIYGSGGLVIANLVIGTLEAVLISKIFNTKLLRSVLIIISANIVSALGGWGIMVLLIRYWQDMMKNALNIVVLCISMFLFTLLIEWPFCHWLLKEKNGNKKQSFKAALIINSCSYVILIATGLIYFLMNHK